MRLLYFRGNDWQDSRLQDYFRIRSAIFTEKYGASRYTNDADDDDRDENTRFTLCEENGQIVGGARIVIHPRFSTRRLPMERHPNTKIEMLFPHLNHQKGYLSYAEIGGLGFSPEHSTSPLRVTRLMTDIFCKAKEAYPPVDFMVGDIRPLSLGINIRAARRAQLHGAVRYDVVFPNDGIERLVGIFSYHGDFPLVPRKLRNSSCVKYLHQIGSVDARKHRRTLRAISNNPSSDYEL